MSERWQRHDLLRVKPEAWTRVLRSCPPAVGLPWVGEWAARGWPVIVRRQAEGDGPGVIPVAFPLPPADGKRRVALQVAPEEVQERVPPQSLRAVREETPPSWQPTVNAVLALAQQTGLEPRVFGSLLWQRLTGLRYLTSVSDLDLLWPVHDLPAAICLVRGLVQIEKKSPVRVDGEILLPDGSGVQWREWHDHPSEVLVKTLSGVQLRAVDSLFPTPLAV